MNENKVSIIAARIFASLCAKIMGKITLTEKDLYNASDLYAGPFKSADFLSALIGATDPSDAFVKDLAKDLLIDYMQESEHGVTDKIIIDVAVEQQKTIVFADVENNNLLFSIVVRNNRDNTSSIDVNDSLLITATYAELK